MGRRPKDVTPAELAVLEILWRVTEATTRQITDELYPRGEASDYATVQKLLSRLTDKELVARQKKGSAVRFSATSTRDELIRRRLRDTADVLCGGSMTPILTQLVRTGDLDDTGRRRLLDLIDELDDGSSRGTAKKTEKTKAKPRRSSASDRKGDGT